MPGSRQLCLVPIGLVMLAGCASPQRSPVTSVSTVVSGAGLEAPQRLVLLPEESSWRDVLPLPGGKLRTMMCRGNGAVWFRSEATPGPDPGARTNSTVVLRHVVTVSARDPAAREATRYLCRGWVALPEGLSPGSEIRVTEQIRSLGKDEDAPQRELLSGPVADDARFLPLLPIEERAIELSEVEIPGPVEIIHVVTIVLSRRWNRVRVFLSPRLLSAAEWQRARRARLGAASLLRLDGSAAMGQFAELYLNTAADYVESHLPWDRRPDSKMHAGRVRDWDREIVHAHPQIHEKLRLTSLRRAPPPHSANLVSLRGERSVRASLELGEGVILDTWRPEGGTELKTQPATAFRKTLSSVSLGATVYPHRR